MEEKLREYAHLIVSVGLNLQKGQTLILSSPVECAPFARLCVSAAYDLGAGEVVLNWTDDYITRERFLRAQDAAFETPRAWRRAFFTDYANEGAAYLRIDAEDPETLLGVSPVRLVAAQRTSSAERETFDRLQMANGFPWCVAGAPIAAWARKVFPDRSEGDAVAALWDAILKTVRVTGDGNAEARWREHIALLTARKEKLNALRFKSLHYTNSLGTDLTIALPDDHLWAAGNSETPAGVGFVANLPTEEIFTAPLKTGVNGTVCAALPLVNNGSIIEDIRFTVREGRIVEARASRGEDVLNAAIAVDDGARYFGEVALVPYDSPIRSSGLLFYNTLYDENASCHLAFGEAYPECIAGGERMTREELDAQIQRKTEENTMNFKPIETDENVLVMPGAVVCGDVTVGEGTAFWFNSVCRAELQPIKIGKRCNIQDCAVIHNLCTLGDDVSVGHGAIVHGATVGDRVIVGMGAIVLDGAKIGDDCIIAAGAVVTGKMDAPAGSLLVGSPAVVAKPLNDKQKASCLENSELYYRKSVEYRAFLAQQGK